ncbi:MAG: spore coat protein [Clostridiales bacterium]|nr:MAG: spore coat protein [Clostridiales bacterium]
MMALTQKEKTLLEDMKKQEQVCVDKYNRYSADACDGQLKNLFSQLGQKETEHLNTINQILNGTLPPLPQSQSSPLTPEQYTPSNCENKKNDEFLCSDALSTEKHVSGEYNTVLFEFSDTAVREMLNHIQKEEQEHGYKIYNYMAQNGMYQ